MPLQVAQWGTLRGSRPQQAEDNGVRNNRCSWLAVTPHPLQGRTPWAKLAQYKSVQPLQGAAFTIKPMAAAIGAVFTIFTAFIRKIILQQISLQYNK